MARLKTAWNITVIIEERYCSVRFKRGSIFSYEKMERRQSRFAQDMSKQSCRRLTDSLTKEKVIFQPTNETVILPHKNVDPEHDNAIYQRIMETECEFRRLAVSTIVWFQCDILCLVNGSIQLRISDDFLKHPLKPIKMSPL